MYQTVPFLTDQDQFGSFGTTLDPNEPIGGLLHFDQFVSFLIQFYNLGLNGPLSTHWDPSILVLFNELEDITNFY